MMRFFLYLFFTFFLFTSCSNTDSCFLNAGNSVFKTIELNSFEVIDIPQGVSVEIVESSHSKIEITSKENYISNLDFKIANQNLTISNTMSCSLFSNYHIATIRIYTPKLKKIVSRTQFKVISVGTLHFPELFIITSVENGPSSYFDLTIDNSTLRLEDNQVGFFKISGKTNWLDIHLYGGTGRIDAQNLKSYDCTFFQRSNNDILINAENKLTGTIYSTGNVYVFNKPKEVDVEQKFKGMLIFK